MTEAAATSPLPTATIDNVTVENPLKGVKWAASDKAFIKDAEALVRKYAGTTQRPEARLALVAYLAGLVVATQDTMKTPATKTAAILRYGLLAGQIVTRADAIKAFSTGVYPTTPTTLTVPKDAAGGLKILGGLNTDTVTVQVTGPTLAGLTK